MTHTEAIDVLLENIEQLQLPKINSLNHLDNPEPTIYLCGKSSTGKTTFLNALFNMERDELFTSTNISTKTEFRFQYGEEENIRKSDGFLLDFPNNYEERKILFRSLNKEGDSYCVTLHQEALKGRVIVDIPGVFDFNRNESFSNRMLDEADVIYFFTPCTAKINESEYHLLESISKAGIPIIVLFTMGDITEVDEGITRKTMPNLVQNRLNSCFNDLDIAHHQIISSNDYYKNKDTHGIDQLQKYINGNDLKHKQFSERNRLKRTIHHYLNIVVDELDVLNTDSSAYHKLAKRENEIWYKSEKLNIEKEKDQILQSLNSELNWLKKNCDEQIFGASYRKIYLEQAVPPSEQEKNFQINWSKFWSNLTEEFNFLEVRDGQLPPFPETLFTQVSVDLDELKEILETYMNGTSNDQDDNSQKRDSKVTDAKYSNQSTTVINTLEIFNGIDLQKLSKVGVNLNNAKIIYHKWEYLNRINSIIDEIKDDLFEQVEKEISSRYLNLEVERDKKIEAALSEDPTTAARMEYQEAFNQLKGI